MKKDQSNGLILPAIEHIEMQTLDKTSPRSLRTFEPILDMPPDCYPIEISKHFRSCGFLIPRAIQRQWTALRSRAHRLVEHRFFEWLIIASILASSTTLVSYVFLRLSQNELISKPN